jgi:hypothetical protein
MFGVYAFSGVAHFQQHVTPRRNYGSSLNVSIIQFHVLGRDGQLATGGHGIASVRGKVHQDLLQLDRIEFHLA